MKNLIIVLIALLSIKSISAQNYKFGKVSKEELEEQINPNDTTANATVLYREEVIHFMFTDSNGFIQIREVHERIKLYNKEGFDWATKKINLYTGGRSNAEKILGLKGVTYNLEGGKISKTKLKKDGIFEEEANEFWKVSTLTMPNIKAGSVIEYTYKIQSPFLAIDDIIFQYTIPTKKYKLRLAAPEYYIYNTLFNPKAFYNPKITKSIESKSLVFKGKTDYVGTGLAGSSSSTSGGSLEYKVKVSKVNEDNIPALKSEEFVTNIENYRSKLILELTAITNPRGGVETFSTSWDKVTKTIYKRPSFGDQLKRTGFFENDVNAIVSGISDEVSKTFLIFNYVKSKVKWNKFYGYSALKGTKKAYNEGDGSVGDINLLLVAMLRSVGVNASPVLVSTRNHGIPLYPTTKGFNYVICMVERGDGYILLDATAKFSTFNTLPTRALNWQGRVVRANGSSAWINLSSTKVSKESTSLNVKINDDYTIEGKVRKSLTEYVAMSYRDRFANASEEDHIKYLERNNGDIEVSELNFENAKNVTKPLKLTYEYQLSDAVEEIGDKLYFSPLLFLATKENPFKQEERLYPIDFIYPFEDKYTVNVMLPEGYKVESLPESGIFDFNNDAGKFSYVIKENGNFLQIKVNFNINKAIILTTDYKIFKEFYGKMVEKQSEQIVLSKT